MSFGDSMSTSPLLIALETWLENRLLDLHTVIPGIVESYDGHDKRTATILPAVNLKVPRGPIIKHTPIPNVPVMFPSSAGFQMVWKLQPGDGVLLLFSEASIGNWIEGAGQVDPEDSTRFSMHDAIAIPGLWSNSKVPKLANDGDFLLVSESGARMGATEDGLLDLSNGQTDLRTEIEKLRTGLTDLATVVGSGLATSQGPVSPVDAPGFLNMTTGWASDKAKLGGLLK